MNEKKIKLQFPIEYKNNKKELIKQEELSLKRLKVKHLKLLPENFIKNAGKMEVKDLPVLIEVLTGLNNEAVNEIDLIDLQNIVEEMEDFFDFAPQTGKK